MRINAEMSKASATLMVTFLYYNIPRFIPVEYLWVIPENHLSLRPQQVK